MNDLISRQAAIDAVERAKTARSADGEIFCAKINAQMNIQLLPTIDAVEVVRCKDCKYFVTNYAVPHCGRTLIGMKKSDYCSFGERTKD